MEKVSNYEITKKRVQKDFLKYDQKTMIEKFHLQYDKEYLYIKFIGKQYRICRNTGLLQWSGDDFVTCTEADFNEALTIYDVLCDSKEHPAASGEYINLESLSSLQSSYKKLGDGLIDRDAKEYDHCEEKLSKACEALGGIRAGKGDVAYEIPVFDFLSCRIQFWNSDEDFPAAFHVFLDKQVLQFMRYETVWYMVGHLKKRLKEEAQSELTLSLQDTEWPLEYTDHDRQIVRAIVFDEEGMFYFVRVERDDDFGRATLIETSGGGVESGEDFHAAIQRELKEELGAEVEVIRKIGVVDDYYNLIHRHNINHFFLCRIRSFGEKNLTKDEVESFHLSTLKLTYEEAVQEYEACAVTRLGRLIRNRELPVLQYAGGVLHKDMR